MASSKKRGFVNPLDALGVEPDELAAPEAADTPPARSQTRRRRPAAATGRASGERPSGGRGKQFESPTDQLSRRDVQRASSSKAMAGQYQRKTITLPPEQVDYINDLARSEGIGLLEFYRWLIDTALMVYEDGYRPEIKAREIRSETQKGHWSSQGE